MKLLYIAKNLPFEGNEAFVLEEVLDHVANGHDVWLAPVGGGRVVHNEANSFLGQTLYARLFSPAVAIAALKALVMRPIVVFGLVAEIVGQSGWRLLPRNLAVFPKGLWLAEKARQQGFDHIHVHWIAVPATMAMIAARIAGIAFSITAHRYDIAQANLVPAKFRHAAFVRAINRRGAEELRAMLLPQEEGPCILPMGVALPAPSRDNDVCGKLATLRLVVGARLIEVKDHETLLLGISHAVDKGHDILLDIFGDGPLEHNLRALAKSLDIGDRITFHGAVSHQHLTDALASGVYDAAVLTSRTLADGTKEGIPVFLMEAMAAGLAVIATPCGGIPELIDDDCGYLVPEGDVQALSDAFATVIDNADLRRKIISNGRAKVSERHDIVEVGRKLRRYFRRNEG